MSNWLHDLAHVGHASHGNPKVAGVGLLIVGFFTAPLLIGIPLMIVGALMLIFGNGSK